jgi:Fe-S cluster biogenesis protein NfuA/nitrite reductase/ring-hydroxylating ferredoxin subunit
MNATLTAELPPLKVNSEAPEKSIESRRDVPLSRGDVNLQEKKIQELIGRVESLPDPHARELMHDCIGALLALHGDGLERILQLIKNAGNAGKEVREALLRDKLVRGLLLIHDLHPVSLRERLREALEKVRPYLNSHGGNVELIQLENEQATLRLEGTCKTCPSSSATLELAVRQAIEEACPDLLGFEVEGMVTQDALTDHLPANAPRWTVLDDFIPLAEGMMRAQEVGGVSVIFFKCGDNLYSYRNFCPGCQNKLSDGIFEADTITCEAGHHFDVRRAGAALDRPELHLNPFPLLALNGMVKISVR